MSKNRIPFAIVEPLESRIAPANIILVGNGATVNYGSTDVFTNTTGATDPISEVIGDGAYYMRMQTGDILTVIGADNIETKFILGATATDGITGKLVAVFVDDGDGVVEINELTGISLGNKVTATISGDVYGDIVTNYDDFLNKIGGSDEQSGNAINLLSNTTGKLFVSGTVHGSIISGGAINNLTVSGTVNSVLAGKAANGETYDFNGAGLADGGDTLVVLPDAKVKGVAISNLVVGKFELIQAGDGGEGAVGGAITNVTVLDDVDAKSIIAGNGGDGGSIVVNGGAGGAISNIIVNGLDVNVSDELDPNDSLVIKAGDGGDAFDLSSKGGVGGAGGTIKSVFVGYEKLTAKSAPTLSRGALTDTVLIEGGGGGDGKTGGAGGAVSGIKVLSSPTLSGNDIEVRGGVGGASDFTVTVGKSGNGGAVSSVELTNSRVDSDGSKVVVAGGDAGLTIPLMGGGRSSGGNGGAVTLLDLIGQEVQVIGGNGADGGKIGGNGGSISKVTMSPGLSGSRVQNVLMDAGSGGTGISGKGGHGGNITAVTIIDSDLDLLNINQTGQAANGGNSYSGPGGKGGLISDININEITVGFLGLGEAKVRSGNGGNGGSSGAGNGGIGGNVTNFNLNGAVDLSLILAAGNGGNAASKGNGGAGGNLKSVSFDSYTLDSIDPDPLVITDDVFATVSGGSGGAGKQTGTGGAGGSVSFANINIGQAVDVIVEIEPYPDILPGYTVEEIKSSVDGGDVTIAAGAGGAAEGGAGGRGGSLTTVGGVSYAGGVILSAGDGGLGGKAALGGSVNFGTLSVGTDAIVTAGDGGYGGAGGSIKSVGAFRAASLNPLIGTIETPTASLAPLGDVIIRAGDGSGGTVAGIGGSITDVFGFLGVNDYRYSTDFLTLVRAGDGGAASNKSAKGGSIKNVSFSGGGGTSVDDNDTATIADDDYYNAEVQIVAGDAGSTYSGGMLTTSVKTGAAGGSVDGVTIGFDPSGSFSDYSVQEGTIIRHIAAGNGGDTSLVTGKGGLGGSVSNISVYSDIGVRYGEGFGFSTMGGVFAGEGGRNITQLDAPELFMLLDGKAGNVTKVVAESIASISAGRLEEGDTIGARNLVTTVGGITVTGLANQTITDGDGTYLNYFTANVLGAVVNPFASDANTFDPGEYGDQGDGVFGLGDEITSSTDGFVAAISFVASQRNLRPEALLTVNSSNLSNFIDLNNNNGQIVIL